MGTVKPLLAPLVMGLITVGTPAHGPEPTPNATADAIVDELRMDPSMPASQIAVQMKEGIVTLSGEVSNLLAKRRAARIAEAVRGVKSVVNTVRLNLGETRPPRETENDIIAAIAAAPVGQSYNVDVAASGDGIVTFDGSVGSWKERHYVENIAAGVRGSDRGRKPVVQRLFLWSPFVDREEVSVKVKPWCCAPDRHRQ